MDMDSFSDLFMNVLKCQSFGWIN